MADDALMSVNDGSGAEPRKGLGGVVLRNGLFMAGQRAGQVQNTLFGGAINTAGRKGFWGSARSQAEGYFLNYRATDLEMSNWRAGQGVIRRLASKLPGIGTESWLATGAAPSLWMASAQMMRGGGAATSNAWRLFERSGYVKGGVEYDAAKSASWLYDPFKTTHNIHGWEDKTFGKAASERFNYGARMSADDAVNWTVQALHMGEAKIRIPGFVKGLEKYGVEGGAYFKHYAMGAFYKLNKSGSEIRGMVDAAKTMKQTIPLFEAAGHAEAAEGATWFLSKWLSQGRAMASLANAGKLGTEAGQVGLELTGLGAKLLPALGFASRAMPYIAIAQTAYDVGKAGWKVGDLYFSKMPRHFYRSLNDQMVRAPFAGIAAGMPDSPVSINNRARAVQSIQMSRLNARSTIGREASMMAQHFG